MTMPPDEQHEILQQVGGLILDSVPDDWSEIRAEFSAVVGMSTTDLTVTTDTGETRKGKFPLQAVPLMSRLRAGMHDDGKGTWYTAAYTIRRPGSFSVDYDYDSEPDFGFEVDPKTFFEDLDHFPRPFESLPDWLREKLVEAHQAMKRKEGDPN
ncbi:hypothetical protein KIK06_23670 [Nocardiopsis sp. EMB25]|uniref:hypothetical protein n=1 Tax=Nocardiopsis sp. EMB25 TaxID=2835867 RepID=UPI00228417E0|nr:hypothetical protein [Nocardiopsis sp. EMB25]MCY9786886.1 hypothetical protein [Nocardiopsis sp. EMB25]